MVSDLAMIALSAAITMSVSAIATAWAESVIGSAAVGAIAEKPEETFSKVLILTVIPETIVIFGLVVAILILGKASGA